MKSRFHWVWDAKAKRMSVMDCAQKCAIAGLVIALVVMILAIVPQAISGCATTRHNRPEVSPPPYFCTKDGTWESEKGHEGCDLMCSLYRGQKWDRKQRECIDVCDLEKGMRWQHSEPQGCVTFCRGGEFLSWGKDGELICDCPSGQSWDKFAGKCVAAKLLN